MRNTLIAVVLLVIFMSYGSAAWPWFQGNTFHKFPFSYNSMLPQLLHVIVLNLASAVAISVSL